jgi:uncharacterized protein YybS (DUF2232 family)
MEGGNSMRIESRTRALTETAFLAALTAVLFFVAQIPVIGPFLCVGCPFPVTLMVFRHGSRRGLVGTGAALLLIVLVQGALAVLALPFLLLGLISGFFLRRGTPPLTSLVCGGVGLGLLLFSVVWPYENVLAERWGMRPLRTLAAESIQAGVGRLVDLRLRTSGVPRTTFEASQEYALLQGAATSAEHFVLAVSWMPLSVMFFLGVFGYWIYYQAARPILGRFEVEVPPLPALEEWSGGPAVSMLLIPVLLPWVAPELGKSPGEIPYLRFMLLNLQVISSLLLALLGIARVDAWLGRVAFPWPLRRILELLLLVLPLPGAASGFRLLLLLGVISPWLARSGSRQPSPEDLSES